METIVTTYDGADLDGYGSSVAYAELLRAQGKDAVARIWGEPHLEAQWLIKTFKLDPALEPQEDREAPVVLIDASDPDSLPGFLKSEQVIEIIDHRKLNRADRFQNAKVEIELVGAAATLVARRFKQAGLEPSRQAALYLYGGIISNTQNFTGVVTDLDREMAGWLKEIAKPPNDLAGQMFLAKSDLAGPKLRQAMIDDSKVLDICGKKVATTQLEIIGADKLLKSRRQELEQTLDELFSRYDYAFLNTKDLEIGGSAILVRDDKTKELLRDAPGITWNGRLGISQELKVRKQITAWINDKLSQQL